MTKVSPSFLTVNWSLSSSSVYTTLSSTSSISSFGNVFNTSATWFNNCSTPSPVTPEILYISNPSFFANFSNYIYPVSSCITSILLATIICFLVLNFSLYFFSSSFIV